MGANISHYPATPANCTVFSLTIRRYDRLKVIDAPAQVLDIIRSALQNYYGVIQDESIGNDGGTSFKLSGCPFSRTTKDLSIKTKIFFANLLSTLYANRWKLWLNSDLSRSYDNSTLFFRRCSAAAGPFSICCLSLSSYDKFQLINAPESLNQVLLDCVGNLLQRRNTYRNCFEVQMYGNLWQNCSFEQSLQARQLMLRIFKHFRQANYSYFGTANIKGTADCIFFINENVTPPPEEYCVISLNARDRLRLIGCPKPLVDMAYGCIVEQWPGGLQDRRDGAGWVEFKMRGNPWYANWREDAVNSRVFITRLLQESVARGWAVLTSLDVSRKVSDKAVFILRNCTPMTIPHFCISPAGYDKIRIIGADSSMRNYVMGVVRQCWTPGVQSEMAEHAFHEFKLCGYPWDCSSISDSFALTRMMMTRVLTALEDRGWSVICSADVSAKYVSNSNNSSSDDHPEDVHSWFVAQTSLVGATGPAPVGVPTGFDYSTPNSSTSFEPPPSYDDALRN